MLQNEYVVAKNGFDTTESGASQVRAYNPRDWRQPAAGAGRTATSWSGAGRESTGDEAEGDGELVWLIAGA